MFFLFFFSSSLLFAPDNTHAPSSLEANISRKKARQSFCCLRKHTPKKLEEVTPSSPTENVNGCLKFKSRVCHYSLALVLIHKYVYIVKDNIRIRQKQRKWQFRVYGFGWNIVRLYLCVLVACLIILMFVAAVVFPTWWCKVEIFVTWEILVKLFWRADYTHTHLPLYANFAQSTIYILFPPLTRFFIFGIQSVYFPFSSSTIHTHTLYMLLNFILSTKYMKHFICFVSCRMRLGDMIKNPAIYMFCLNTKMCFYVCKGIGIFLPQTIFALVFISNVKHLSSIPFIIV